MGIIIHSELVNCFLLLFPKFIMFLFFFRNFEGTGGWSIAIYGMYCTIPIPFPDSSDQELVLDPGLTLLSQAERKVRPSPIPQFPFQ